jgi:hypothetical protein
MNLSPDQPPLNEPKLTPAERWARDIERLKALGLRSAIGQELDAKGIVDPAAIGDALALPALQAERLLKRYQWREGDVALLEVAAMRLGLTV